VVAIFMATVTDAVFFFRDGNVIKEMMMTEFDALLDGIAEMPEFKKQKMPAVYAQIDGQLKIRGLVFFLVGFTAEGNIVPEWNLPIQQLMQSAGRGPDLGAGAIRLVCKSQSGVPWHQESLWDPQQQTLQMLTQTVKRNRLGIIEGDEEEFVLGDSWEDIPTLAAPPVLTPYSAEPPMITPSFNEIPVISPVMSQQLSPPVLTPVTTPQNAADAQAYATLKMEFDAMRAAHSVRIDKLQKERDELKEKNKSIADSVKEQAKEQLQSIRHDFDQDIEKKTQQIESLKTQIEIEQKRYAELKEQLVLQAQKYQAEREELVDQLKQDIDSDKIEGLKEAFKKELNARMEAETSKVNEALAMREVELFYREEQLKIFKDEIVHLKEEKQAILKESGRQILEALVNNGVTLVAYNVGVGHITLPLEDVGRYLDERLFYLADRCGVSPEVFALWQEHYHKPVCHHVDAKGDVCNKPIKRIDLASQFAKGLSDRCQDHQPQPASA
jgi:hypothetical protein